MVALGIFLVPASFVIGWVCDSTFHYFVIAMIALASLTRQGYRGIATGFFGAIGVLVLAFNMH